MKKKCIPIINKCGLNRNVIGIGEYASKVRVGDKFWYVKNPFTKGESILQLKMESGWGGSYNEYATAEVIGGSYKRAKLKIGDKLHIARSYVFPRKPFCGILEDQFGLNTNYYVCGKKVKKNKLR